MPIGEVQHVDLALVDGLHEGGAEAVDVEKEGYVLAPVLERIVVFRREHDPLRC